MNRKTKYNRIKAALADRNLSSKDLALKLNKSESTISRWCTNDTQPSIPVLFEIAAILKMSVMDLLISNLNNIK